MDIVLGLVIGLIGSITATLVYVAIVWRLDRYEKEPVRLLAAAFAWGLVPAIIISIVLEALISVPLDTLSDGGLATMALEAGVAPIVEESAKGIALLAFLVFSYRELDNALDGIIYGAMIGFGFALTENVLYVVAGVAEKGLAVGVVILFLRTIVFGVNHAFFTGLTGAAVGAARLRPTLTARLPLLAIGWLLAVTFHAIHNLGTSLAETTGLASLSMSLVSNWGGVLVLLMVVVLVWRKERGWIVEELASEVALGLLTPDEYAAVSTTTGRQRLLARTLRRDGWAAYRRLGRLYQLFTELAFKKHQVRIMGDERGLTEDIVALRQRIVKEKGRVAPHTDAALSC